MVLSGGVLYMEMCSALYTGGGNLRAYRKFSRGLDRITKEEYDDWNRITFRAFHKIWILVFVVEVFLFLFFKPNAECGRLRYFWLFIVKPSGMQGLALLVVEGASLRKRKVYNKREMFLGTIILISIFAASAIWIHTSVELMSMLLMLPLIITTLYKDRMLTWIQLVICIAIYVLKELYFYPHTPYFPPLNSFINVTIFCGSIFVELFLIQHVQDYVGIMEKKANRDSMTGLYNHKVFYEKLEQEYLEHKKDGSPLSLIVIDIDNFKQINDTYGHAFGDEVICKVAGILTELKDPCLCARYGGEEFAVILNHAGMKQAVEIAEQIRHEFIAHEFVTKEGSKKFTVSIGVAENKAQYKEGKEIFLNADAQLYRAKQNGRNQVCYEMKS